MSNAAPRSVIPATHVERLRAAREVLHCEADALLAVANQLSGSFCEAVDLLLRCRGNVIVTGVGKAGLVGRKITATLSSTGTPAHFLHPTEAVHGDLGCLNPDDIVLALSNSGESAEVVALLDVLATMELPVVAITANSENTLAERANIVITTGKYAEAGELSLAPTTSTTAMIGVGDALALVTSKAKRFGANDFAQVHPAGKIGARLKRVREVMRPPEELRIASERATVRDLLVQVARPGRRTGAVLLVNAQNQLSGLFTDSDLARLLEQRRDEQLDQPACQIMTPNPITTLADVRVSEAIELLSSRKLSELPVVDSAGQPIGLLDITDLIGIESRDTDTRPPLKITA